MQHNKAYSLLESLSEKEKKQLIVSAENELSNNQQKLLHYLLKNIAQNKGTDEAEVVLLKVYKQKYTITRSAALRNDYTAITKFARNYIVSQSILNNSDKNNKNYQYELSLSLLNRKAFVIFEKEIVKTIDDIIANEDYENFNRFFNLFVQYKITSAKNDIHTFSDTYSYILQFQKTIEKVVCNTIINYNMLLNHAATSVRMYDNKFQGENITIPKQYYSIINSSDLLQFKSAKMNSYQADLNQNIHYNLKKMSILPAITTYYTIDFEKERISTDFNLFTYYSLLGNFDNAAEIGEKMMLFFKNNRKTTQPLLISSFTLNYLSTLFRKLEIEKAKNCFIEFEEILNHHHQGNRVNMFRIFIYLFQKKYEAAYNIILHLVPVEDSFDKILIKIIECIVYYGRKDYELALNNLTNIMQSINYNNIKEDVGYIFFAENFKKLLQIDLATSKNDKKIMRQTLKETIGQTFDKLSKSNTAYMLPLVWIKYELQQNSK